MNQLRAVVGGALALAILAVSSGRAEVPPEDLAKIRAAAPFDAPAEPKQPRKLLVFSLANDYRHESIPWGREAFRILGEKSGAYAAILSDDPAMFDRDKLATFDAVLLNNNCGDPVKDPTRRKNFLEYVRGGRGLIGIHCAAHLDWPEYTQMLGGYSISHPWNSGSTVTVKLDDPGHPVVACFARSSFLHTDEVFEFRDYSRAKLRVLLSLDTERTDMTVPGITRNDGDFGLSWVRGYGRGRVFYCEFGHQKDVYWRPVILKHYLAGIQFALGDLEAETTASQDSEGQKR